MSRMGLSPLRSGWASCLVHRRWRKQRCGSASRRSARSSSSRSGRHRGGYLQEAQDRSRGDQLRRRPARAAGARGGLDRYRHRLRAGARLRRQGRAGDRRRRHGRCALFGGAGGAEGLRNQERRGPQGQDHQHLEQWVADPLAGPGAVAPDGLGFHRHQSRAARLDRRADGRAEDAPDRRHDRRGQCRLQDGGGRQRPRAGAVRGPDQDLSHLRLLRAQRLSGEEPGGGARLPRRLVRDHRLYAAGIVPRPSISSAAPPRCRWASLPATTTS